MSGPRRLPPWWSVAVVLGLMALVGFGVPLVLWLTVW